MRDRTFLAVLSLFLCTLPVPSTHARPAPTDTIYVDRDATGAEDGSSWADAYTSLQDALAEARTNGTDDAVWVAEGTYYPDEGGGVQADDRTASFHVESGIDLHGRFEGTEERLDDRTLSRGMNKTILSGEIQQDADSTNNAYTVLRLTGGAAGEIEVTGGQADGTGVQGEGGGAYVTGGALHHAVLTDNHARRGSAIYAKNSPTLAVARVTGNHVTETGTVYLDGGAATLRHVTIADNTAESGANAVQFVDADATVEDFAFGPDATNDVQSFAVVTATFNGNTDEEGQTLPDADITIRNADADTLVTTTTSDASGYYETTTSYPDDQAYTASIIANTSDHEADTTDVTLGSTDDTYTNNFNLERLIHDLTINADDANTGDPVNTSGTITANGNTLTSYTTGSDGETTVTINTAADQVTNEADTTNYDPATETLGLGADKQITSTLSLPPIQYEFNGTVTDADGQALNDADVTLDDDDTSSDITVQTNTSGEYTLTATVNDGFEENDDATLTADKDNHEASSTATTTNPDDRTKTMDFSLTEESTTDRIPITFTNETVADTLYSGDDYGDDFTTTVSTDDTTFTVEGTVTADVPLKDGDALEITHSDDAYINTFVANNTDTEQPPHEVSGFPDEPDYQSNSTITIPKSDVVNSYQVKGIPDTSPEGYSTIDDWKPHLDLQAARRFTELGGYDSLATFIQEGHPQSWEDKADTVVPEVQGFMPIPIDGPEYVTDEELQDIFDNRNDNNITRIDLDNPSFTMFYKGDYIENSSGFFSDSNAYGTIRAEVYGAFTGLDEINGNYVTEKILDSNDQFIEREAAFPINIIYNLNSDTTV